MKASDLMTILGRGKLRLVQRTLPYDVCYDLTLDATQRHLPRLVVLPLLHEEPVPTMVVRECARQLGLTPVELEEAVRCNIGRPTMLLAIAVVCHEARKRFHLNADYGWPSRTHPLGETIGLLLAEIDNLMAGSPSPAEARLLKRLHDRRFVRCPIGKKIERSIKAQLATMTPLL